MVSTEVNSESGQRPETSFNLYIAIVLNTRAACQRNSNDMFLLYCSVYYMGFYIDILSLWTMKEFGQMCLIDSLG